MKHGEHAFGAVQTESLAECERRAGSYRERSLLSQRQIDQRLPEPHRARESATSTFVRQRSLTCALHTRSLWRC